MYLIKDEEEFKKYVTEDTYYNYDEIPEQFPCYVYTYDGGDGIYYKALYSEDLENMLTKLKGN